MKRFRILVAVAAVVLTIGTPARAADQKRAKAPSKPAGQRAAPKAAPPGAKVLRLEEMKVEGRIRKPQAMFLLPRAHLNPGEVDRTEPLLPKVTKAVEREPF